MRKLATTLYSANRELKAILRNSKFGVTFSHLRETTQRISLLSASEFEDLMEYTRQTETVLQYRIGEEDAFILIANLGEAPADPGKHDYQSGTIVFDPRKKEAPVEKKEERVPTIQNNREKPQQLNVSKYKDELTGIDSSLHVEAVEIMGTVDTRNFGATISELGRVCPRFDYLEPEQQKYLVDLLHKTSVNYSYVDADGLPRRSPGVMVLVHNQYLGKEHFTWEDNSSLPNSALADQLSALKGKIKLAPERPVAEMPKVDTRLATKEEVEAPEHVVGSRITRSNPMLSPGHSRSAASQPATRPAIIDLAATKIPTPIVPTLAASSGRPILPVDAFVAGVNRTTEGGAEQQSLDTGIYAFTDEGISTTSLADIQKQMGDCLGRIATNQAQISVAQISINSANAAITNDVALMSKLNEGLKRFVK